MAEQTVDEDGRSQVGVRVHPTLVPLDHPLASVNGSFNAVFVEGEASGDLMLYGRGAGGRPSASAVLGDLIDAAGNLHRGHGAVIGDLEPVRIAPIDDVTSAFYLNLEVDDRPVVIDFRVAAEEKVYPMVPSGASNSELVVPPSQQGQPR